MSALDDLLCGKRLWNIKAPLGAQIKAMRKVRDKIKEEHEDHINDPDVCLINTGVLLGALNLIDGLLEVKK